MTSLSTQGSLEPVEIRCPDGPKRLLAILRVSGPERPRMTSDNLLEFSCHDCVKFKRRAGNDVARVLHRYNMLGELIESVDVAREDL